MVFLKREFTVGNKLYTMLTSGEIDVLFRLKLKITSVESTYPANALIVPLCPLFSLVFLCPFLSNLFSCLVVYLFIYIHFFL